MVFGELIKQIGWLVWISVWISPDWVMQMITYPLRVSMFSSIIALISCILSVGWEGHLTIQKTLSSFRVKGTSWGMAGKIHLCIVRRPGCLRGKSNGRSVSRRAGA